MRKISLIVMLLFSSMLIRAKPIDSLKSETCISRFGNLSNTLLRIKGEKQAATKNQKVRPAGWFIF